MRTYLSENVVNGGAIPDYSGLLKIYYPLL
jgi:hypothetical protein